MDKKNVSILGSCVSREMFNTSILSKVFKVDCYAFKNCVWDLFGESFDIPPEAFDKIEIPAFAARMLTYCLNKTTIAELEKFKSEYLLIDLLNIRHNVTKLTYNGKTVYIQDNDNNYPTYKDKISQVKEFSEIKSEQLTISDIPEQQVIDGLTKFAEWAKQNYDEKKIIINNFAISESYFSLDNQYKNYDKDYINSLGYDLCETWTKKLYELLPNSIFLDKVKNLVSQYTIYDGLHILTPSIVHFSNESYIRMAENFLNALSIDNKDYVSHPLTPLEYECCLLKNQYVKLYDEQKTLKQKSLSLEKYIKKFENLSDFIFIFTSKDGVSFNTGVQRALSPIINATIPKANKFIAVINKAENFAKYNTSPNEPVMEHSVNNKTIRVESTGWGSTSKSKIIIKDGDKIDNIEFDTKGLNFLVLNSRSLEFIDKGNCDTDSAELVVYSEYIINSKIKI